MGIIAWIVVGLIAGLLAKLVMPGDDPGGIIVTVLIGMAGALIGGFHRWTSRRQRGDGVQHMVHPGSYSGGDHPAGNLPFDRSPSGIERASLS